MPQLNKKCIFEIMFTGITIKENIWPYHALAPESTVSGLTMLVLNLEVCHFSGMETSKGCFF